MTKVKKKLPYSWKKKLIYFSQAFIKDVQATKEAFSPQRRTSSTSKHKIS
jgi:hypothetical protein